MALTRKEWILLLLKQDPLDRIHIMKALFLIWHRSGRNIPVYFEFIPYLYGPCSFEVYSVLTVMESSRLIVQPPHPIQQWASYYLTEKGKKEVKEILRQADPDTLRLIEKVALEVSRLSFYQLLQKVYSEAPDFSANSMFREVLKP